MALGGLSGSGSRDPVDVHVRDLSASGEGVGRLPDGRAIFVPGALPGERVQVRVIRDKARFARAELSALLHPSSHRRDPPCPLFGTCGGCQVQHLRYGAQLAWKSSRIAQALRRIGGVDVPEPEVEPASSEWGYRNRMSFTLKRLRSGRVVAGLHRAGRPGHVVEIRDECLLPEPQVLEAWTALRMSWGPGASLLPPGDELRLTLRRAGEGAALVVEGGRPGGDATALIEGTPGLLSVAHRPRDGELRHLAGQEAVRDRWFGEEVPVASGAFMQVNREAGEAVHLSVLKELGNPAGLRIVDGYCGVGAYGRRLARHGAEVVGLELDAEAVRAAALNAPPGLQVRRGRVEELLAEALPADRVILNPPRTGLHPDVPDLLRSHPVPRVVYVSCDPATLARDLARLGEDYRVRRVRGFDLFPQTTHVETVVTLDHANPSKGT